MTDNPNEIEGLIDLTVTGIGEWVTLSLGVPEKSADSILRVIAETIGAAKGLAPDEITVLSGNMVREWRAQHTHLIELTEVARAEGGTTSDYRWTFPFLDDETQSNLEALAAARGLSPVKLELEVLRRGIDALEAETRNIESGGMFDAQKPD